MTSSDTSDALPIAVEDNPEAIARDVAAISAISAVPSMLRVVCQATGMGFAAVARVTDGTWTACAVEDNIQFGLKAGGQLPVHTTLCIEARAARLPVVFDHASQDPTYKDHHTPRLYHIESYISVPIVLADGEYFGNLCAIDPQPRNVSQPQTVAVFQRFAEVIAMQLEDERRRLETEIELFSERAKSELRDHFIAVLGHDLRNPLQSIGMIAETLSRHAGDAQAAGLGDRLRTTVRRMSRLIDDVLDLARGRLGAGISLSVEGEASLGQLLENVVGEMRTAHPGRAIHSRIDIAGPVRCDRGRVQQLLSNMLDNALTYSGADHSVTVTADLIGEDLEIAVYNEGAPIASEVLARVFEPYWRPATSGPRGGLGLGLYICAQIAKAHGGGMQVTSSVEDGTMFLARLRVA